MTQEQKAKAYDEAIKKAREIKEKIVHSHLSTDSCKAVSEYIDTIIPELAESEDERIRKALIEVFKKKLERGFEWVEYGIPNRSVLDWLEKQKNLISYYEEKLDRCACENLDKGIKEVLIHPEEYGLEKQKEPHYTKRNALFDKCVENCDPEVMKEVSDEIDEMLKKEQKPVDLSEMLVHKEPYIAPIPAPIVADEHEPAEPTGKLSREEYLYQLLIDQLITYSDYEYLTGKKPVEWSEEDERMLSRCVKSIESSKQFADSDTFKKAKDNEIDWLTKRLKSFRPQYHGDVTMTEAYKMGLEAGKASSWKPSEQEKGALRTAIHILTDERSFPKAAKQLQNILDAFEGKESRKDWKPSEEQMEALSDAYVEANTFKKGDILESLYNDLKKLK